MQSAVWLNFMNVPSLVTTLHNKVGRETWVETGKHVLCVTKGQRSSESYCFIEGSLGRLKMSSLGQERWKIKNEEKYSKKTVTTPSWWKREIEWKFRWRWGKGKWRKVNKRSAHWLETYPTSTKEEKRRWEKGEGRVKNGTWKDKDKKGWK